MFTTTMFLRTMNKITWEFRYSISALRCSHHLANFHPMWLRGNSFLQAKQALFHGAKNWTAKLSFLDHVAQTIMPSLEKAILSKSLARKNILASCEYWIGFRESLQFLVLVPSSKSNWRNKGFSAKSWRCQQLNSGSCLQNYAQMS
jgi:hypothetical protein